MQEDTSEFLNGLQTAVEHIMLHQAGSPAKLDSRSKVPLSLLLVNTLSCSHHAPNVPLDPKSHYRHAYVCNAAVHPSTMAGPCAQMAAKCNSQLLRRRRPCCTTYLAAMSACRTCAPSAAMCQPPSTHFPCCQSRLTRTSPPSRMPLHGTDFLT